MEMNRKGNCLNFGNCPKADRKEIIELGITEDFVCPECNGDLNEIVKKANPLKKMLIPISIIAIVIIIGAGYAYLSFQETNVDTVVATEQSDVANPDSINNSNAGKVPEDLNEKPLTDVKEDIPIENTQKTEKVEKTKNVVDQPTKTKISKTLNFPFGYYKGETVNGLMHGIGTLYFTQSQIISSRDPKKRIAEEGETVSGTWFEGYLDQGKWFSKTGEQKGQITIGH